MTEPHRTSAIRPTFEEGWGRQLEADFDEYMDRLYEYAESGSIDEDIVDASGIYFCGCPDCERRATWTFLMVRFIEAYRDGIITLEEVPR